LQDEALVQEVLKDPQTSRLTDAEKALFTFIDKVNRDSPRIGPADIQPLHAAGWTDEAIYDALTVCALFNFFNRWIDASGVHAMSDEAHRAAAKKMAQSGYIRTPE
jgi:alkylhydroperoxidase family enzyme